ncbi:ferredoxin [Nocardioides marmoriginsengisoli]|uniref:Ferredoxin n=1 Tax=Nocardioides marmoriginsengisoli TaxID=661483 RepID=A0A3N0CPV2_9ACTN|nr:ferredoxin [Nocardioides marmoriginsengisoli]RNL65369.1 ferredoxin [Nocardioides marmoriginsengisoli]
MKITVEAGSCIAAGVCVGMAPDHFDQDDEDGIVLLLDDAPAPDSEAAVRTAAEACPVRAIRLSE